MKKHFRAIELKYLDDATIMKIRDWRNQDFVRKNMLQQHIITKEEHLKYIKDVKQDKNRGLFVFYLDGEPFAVFQYRLLSEEKAVIPGTYLIHENYQIMGYGSVLDYMANQIIYYYLDVEKIFIQILSSNKERLKNYAKPQEIIKNPDGMIQDVYQYRFPVVLLNERGRIGKVVMQMIEAESLKNMVLI